MHRSMLSFSVLLGLATVVFGLAVPPPSSQTIFSASTEEIENINHKKDARVLILGGGVSGVIAARTLHEQGISDFVIVEARDELGGRMRSHTFGAPEREFTVELGANWISGTESASGSTNPLWGLAKRYRLKTAPTHYEDSLTTYDDAGEIDFLDVFAESTKNFARLVSVAGSRVPKRLVDLTARSGYSLTGSKPVTRYAMASEYYQFDLEFGATPEETSWLTTSWNHNYTHNPEAGGFSEEDRLCIDRRGFKTLIQSEAEQFLAPQQLRLNSTVRVIASSKHGVAVTLADGTKLTADYALCTFSLGVLQHDDVGFEPSLPMWKQEAIHSMNMGTYTKIFLQFPYKFWFDTEMGLYADYERGRYPVWQSLDHPDFLPGSAILFVTVTHSILTSLPTTRAHITWQGEFSKRIEALPDHKVQAEVVSVLQTMLPEVEIPEPLDFYFPRWHSDPLYRGSYSNWPASFLSEHQSNLRANVNERLWFAGEATSRKYFGFLHGAYSEGREIGLELARCIKHGASCIGLEHIDPVQNARPYNST